ncbi:HET domain-containing protein [Ustulina deusta]|nr:HET domain-containing protein [Ustulina deusta]
MWLINIKSMSLEEFTPPNLPSYAILSHTWENDEVTFQEFNKLESAQKKAGFAKIEKTCELAAAKGIPYVWVDTCCIDKSSSAELSEAINSMFEWYKLSTVCFAYLSDLIVNPLMESPTLWRDKKRRLVCRWFQRGWTLQELLAPASLEFYDKRWIFRGLKTDSLVVQELVPMTGIDNRKVFENSDAIREVAVGERMSWASRRQTKRLEDLAYCLLGIFQVNMPLLYGEGMRAFQRLQEEIIKTSTDMSLFCWKAKRGESEHRGLLAHSPAEFASYYYTALKSRRSISWSSVGSEKEFSVTNKGIRIDAELLNIKSEGRSKTALRCNLRPDDYVVLIPIRHYRDNVYVREQPGMILSSHTAEIENKLIYIAKDVDGQMSQDLADHVDPTLSFIVSPLPARFRLLPVRGWPMEQWRHDSEHFQLTNAKISTCIAVYQLTHEGQESGEFAAICQRNASAVQSLRYALVSMREVEDTLRRLEGSTEERIAALSLIEKYIVAGQQTVEVEPESTGLNLFVSKYSPSNEQQLNTLYISLASTDDLSLSKRAHNERLQKDDEIGPSSGGVKRSKNLEDVGSEVVIPDTQEPSMS